ncbi:HTH-type transcriptional regulator/antitoxin HigA [Microbacterium testaceum]|uniref:HigA family addiction module antitoxin n=1 Tax=Microbacterium testaceum TaxID=2033 RepID=UPI0027891E58|nr:HigA family addiction module antitoxin [Microbacterium testaceum]MDQ1115388.1 HTH-type transcriptional regulator/antitoxin HigA [Microbacterium testaceum]
MATLTDYAVAPGQYLDEWLEESSLTQQEAANRLGVSRKHVNEIVNGRAPVTPETALKLERLTGIPADSWVRFEARYRLDLARLRDDAELARHASKIPPTVSKYLRSLGATDATMRTPATLVADFLRYHGCATWGSFEDRVVDASQGDFALAALKESNSSLDHVSCATWLRAGEQHDAFQRGRRFTFDRDGLLALLPTLRERASVPDPALLADLAEMLAGVGVIYMFVDAPDKLPVYGMTRWIDKRVPVIQQSGRRLKDGFIIWAFFHEIGHVLHDPRGELHLEYTTERKRTSAAEKAANEFAFQTLFGSSGLEPFDGLRSDSAIERAARAVGIAPGVAVQQLHRRRKLDYSYGNRLFVELDWDH